MKWRSIAPLGPLMALVLLLVVPARPASAQEDDSWQVVLAPYFLAPSMNGTVTVRGQSADVDLGPSDIFKNLEFGLMLYFEAHDPDWAFIIDGLYMRLGVDGATPITERAVDVTTTQFAGEVSGLRRVADWAEVGIGGRLNVIDATLEIEPGQALPGTDVVATNTWFDFFVATRLMVPMDGRWRLGVRGDFGGFGLGSDYAWQVYPFVGYRFGKVFELAFAYRALSMKYQKEKSGGLFVYDVTTFGPELGAVLHF